MSLKITLDEPQVVVKQPAVTETKTEIVIDRIVDIPSQRLVFVMIDGQKYELDLLSGPNYDVPQEWTNADVLNAVRVKLGLQ